MGKGKIIVTVGISGSGKSTWAHKKWVNNPEGTIIVNRDKIRELIFGYTESNIGVYYATDGIGNMEKLVSRYEDTLIHEGLNYGKTVILDATHLQRKYLEKLKYWNVFVEVKLFDIDVVTAVGRDIQRKRFVGETVIKNQYNNFVKLMKTLEDNPIDFTPVTLLNSVNRDNSCVIFDIDGTLAHNDGLRSPFAWNKVGQDRLDFPTRFMTRVIGNFKLDSNVKVIICTGRDVEALDETEKWLERNKVPYDEIYIRPKGDQRADWIVKEEMWRKIAKSNSIIGMFDDRNQVCRRARALGLKVFQVEYGNF